LAEQQILWAAVSKCLTASGKDCRGKLQRQADALPGEGCAGDATIRNRERQGRAGANTASNGHSEATGWQSET
jgi:hypothetical protein